MLWPIILPSLEVGMWIGWLTGKVSSRDHVRERLINGTEAAKTIAVLDQRLERQTQSANRFQRKTAAGVTRGIRFFARTRAFELAVLKILQDKWPGTSQSMPEVKLHL